MCTKQHSPPHKNNKVNYVNSECIKLLIFVEHATVMDHKYKALLQNIPTRHVITAIAKPADRPQQITKLRNLDINNFFILGSLQSIRDVLGGFLFWFIFGIFVVVAAIS